MPQIQHLVFYQHNVQQFFRRHLDSFDGVLIPLSIATSFPGGTYGFLRALFSLDADMTYAIDPRSALFQKAWNRANVRKPHKLMADVFGPPFPNVGLVRPLEPGDFPDAVIEQVTDSTLSVQKGFAVRQEEKKKLAKYMKLMGLDDLPEIANPQFLVPPYFQVRNSNDPWLEISLKAVRRAIAKYGAGGVRPILHFQNWAGMAPWAPLIERLRQMGVGSILLYPNYFREHDAAIEELQTFRSVVTLLTQSGITPFMLHGGYFSMAMAHFGLAGFGNGIGYGEWRDSGYHKGGSADLRLYVPKLHRFLDVPAAQQLASDRPGTFSMTTEVLTGKPLATVTLGEGLDHFMICRRDELRAVREGSLTDIRAELASTAAILQEIGPLESDTYGASLRRWRTALG